MHLRARRIHIAGSADADTSRKLLGYAHDLVRDLTAALAAAGSTFVAQAGTEPVGPESGQAITFDWTVLETAAEVLRAGATVRRVPAGKLIASVSTHKTERQIPNERRALWGELQEAGALRLEYIEGNWTSGALRRERQAQLGDVLIVISGGEGVEHLAQLYAAEGKPVIPLDLDIGSSTQDGHGGGVWLNKEALAHPHEFFRLADASAGSEHLAAAGTRQGETPTAVVITALLRLIEALLDPEAFYVRLLNPKVPEYPEVERFFRGVVDPVVADLGYARAEMGEVVAEEAFMNVEIFKRIHHSGLVVVDLTGVRANCAMELGYAFGRLKQVVLTAADGTVLPFDPAAIDTHLWSRVIEDAQRIEELKRYRARTAHRPPLVKPRGWHG